MAVVEKNNHVVLFWVSLEGYEQPGLSSSQRGEQSFLSAAGGQLVSWFLSHALSFTPC